ncbi:aldehyde dehydrogenase [Naematelia encephala]|uniref:Aldehyde dehydrogenase n=1 Tax=Naematelia encephala TaxID=71784 RepID=A0A1Y2BKZ7_9TREE|nr:aldehyde dehydrogenase [Naematelia encephala]
MFNRVKAPPPATSRGIIPTADIPIARVPLLINGKELLSPDQENQFNVFHPDGKHQSSLVQGANENTVNEAIDGAKAAFSSWSRLPAVKRRDILWKAAELLQERQEELAEAYRHDTHVAGMITGFDNGMAAEHLKSAASIATEIKGEIPPVLEGTLSLVTRVPYGVIFSISPFNMGSILAVRTFCYALACGNTVVWKANPIVPSLHMGLCKVMWDAGVPAGALQMIQFAPGTEERLTEQVMAHPDIRLVNFTGSTRVGSIIGRLAGQYVKPAILELGGNAPALVLASADIELAANNIVFGGMVHSGQICMSTSRVVVVEEVADALTKALEAIAKEHLTSFGRMGLATQGGWVKYLADLRLAEVSEGAVVLGDPMPLPERASTAKDATGYAPVILDKVTADQHIYFEETFGPSLVIIRAKDVEDGIRIANDSDVGLSASVWSRDYKEALDVAQRLETGAVHINSTSNSGFGRFNSMAAGMAFTTTKSITMHEPKMLPLEILV